MNKLALNLSRAGCFLLLASLLSLAACKSTETTGPTPTASVLITGNTPGQIRDAAIEVFSANGFKATQSGNGALFFEKLGGSMSNFAYGSWLGDDPVWVRVKAFVMPAGEMTYRLQCSAFIVKDRNGATEEELPLTRLHHRSYQRLLNEVASRFAHN